MRRSLVLLACLLAISCGGEQDRERTGSREESGASSHNESADMAAPLPAGAESRAGGGPNVSPTAAPGVAFNYRYAFRLPGERISAVLEHHARMCEQLGTNRCRITGMNYRVVNERDIEGRLAMKLEPAIARRFGQEGVDAVVRAEGMLVESEISGTDVAPTIRAAGRGIAEMGEELRRIEAQLARRGMRADERANLEYQAQQLRSSIRAAQGTREEAQESLANTPLVFEYGSGDLVPGFDTRRPIRHALEQAGNNFIEGVAILFVILATILPWALLGLLLWLIYRRLGRRLVGAKRMEAAAPTPDARVDAP